MGTRALTVAAVGLIGVVSMVGAWVRYGAAPSRNSPTMATSVPTVRPPVSSSTRPTSSRCGDRSAIELEFGFADKEAPWQRGRSYELELLLDSSKYSCRFEVPVQDLYGRGENCRFDGKPNTARATFGIQVRGKPVRVEARILSGGAVFYRGAVAPDYGEPLEDCVYPVHLAFASETGEN